MLETNILKWTGSKRPIADKIIQNFPSEIDTYYEPFCGGCSVGMEMMKNKYPVKEYIFSDINNDSIQLLTEVKNNPDRICDEYERLHNSLCMCKSEDDKVEFYNKVRNRLNKNHIPSDFLFINRTCTNGVIRYNYKGDFNSSFHHGRDGIKPNLMRRIIYNCHNLFVTNKCQFICQDYRKIDPNPHDFVYMDPPYDGSNALYFGSFSKDDFNRFIKTLKCGYAINFNGDSESNNTHIDKELYDKCIVMNPTNSSFRRTFLKKSNVYIYENLYIKNVNEKYFLKEELF